MADYGIATDSLPMFLGSETLIEHIATLRIKNRDIQRDNINAKTGVIDKSKFDTLGWHKIADKKLELNDLIVFIGVQSLAFGSQDPFVVPLDFVKFRHKGNNTEARIAIRMSEVVNSDSNFKNLDLYTEIFIYTRLNNISPNTGYGVHIYDAQGNLKYKDGIRHLMNMKRCPIYFQHQTDPTKLQITNLVPENRNSQLRNIGAAKAILQTAHYCYSTCYQRGDHWYYSGGILTAYLKSNGDISLGRAETFEISGRKKHRYVTSAKGGSYLDALVVANHVLIIDKP